MFMLGNADFPIRRVSNNGVLTGPRAMPFKPATMTQGSGLSNAMAVSTAGGAGWSNAAKGAVKTNTARDSSSYIQRRKFAAVGKSMGQVGQPQGSELSFKSSGCCEVQHALRMARKHGYVVPPKVSALYLLQAKTSGAGNIMALAVEPAHCQPANAEETRILVNQWVEDAHAYHDSHLQSVAEGDQVRNANKTLKFTNKATSNIITVQGCNTFEHAALPVRYNELIDKLSQNSQIHADALGHSKKRTVKTPATSSGTGINSWDQQWHTVT